MSVKAYEIEPLLENFMLSGDKVASKIECIESCGRYVYVGTNDSHVVKYIVEEILKSNGKSTSTLRKESHKLLDIKKPVRMLKAASALDKLVALCDTTLVVLGIGDLEPISGSARLKNVSTFCVNENPNVNDPFCVQICVAPSNKAQLSVYNITAEDKLSHVSTSNVVEPVTCLAADCGFICAALRSKYIILNFRENFVQELFPYSTENFAPLVCRVAKEEFLLCGPDGLGMFVKAEGMSSRPPLQWSYPLIAMAFHHPYVLGVSHHIVMVHSILDQQQKQAITFSGGHCIGNYEGRVFVCSAISVHALNPVPWEKQVEMLLADERVEEALSLTEKVSVGSRTRDHVDQIKRRFKQQAAFIYFSRADMERALELFLEAEVDERELISIFPGLLPASTSFVRAVPPLSNIADVVQLFHNDASKILSAKQFLLHFLQMAHESRSSSHALEVDTALVKLYVELGEHTELEALLQSVALDCDIRDCTSWLEKHESHHALALLCLHVGKTEHALSIWSRIISGELHDSRFPGLQFFVEVISSVMEAELVWRYADIVLDQDELVGVGMFTQQSSTSKTSSSASAASTLNLNTVVDYLQRYPRALIAYLEHVVYEKKMKEEKFHTQLAAQYLEQLMKLPAEQETRAKLRSRLRRLLVESDQYRPQFLLPKVRDAGLDFEMAILFGKAGEHEKALDIFVKKLRDFPGAEEYCLRNGRCRDGAHNPLLHALLAIYLDPKLESANLDEYLVPALELLNKHAADFDAIKVLEIVPSHWSLGILDSFLHGAVRASLHKFRMTKLESALAKGECVRQETILYKLQKHSLKLQESNYCCVCKKPFTDGKFVRYPNDVMTHVECGRRSNICPLTGHCFTSLNAVHPGR